MLRRFGILILLMILAPSAHAEYRVFLLKITDANKQELRSFKSTLDPEQYVFYYPLAPGEFVSYTETWMCWKRTSYLELCDNPKPAATTPPSVETSAPP